MVYSDNGVDGAVMTHFPGHVGYACDVGASDGHFISNTRLFEEQGWTVLCVEPNPFLAREGRERRKLWREVAAGPQDMENVPFCVVGAHPYASNSGPDVGSLKIRDGTHVTVRMRKLDTLLEEAGFPRLDFLTVDVEGFEAEVMKGFTVERWRPKVIVLEEWENTVRIEIPNYKILEKRSYDNIYVREVAWP